MVRLTSPNTQLEEFPADALCSPESIVCCHLLDQDDRLGRELRLSRARLRFVFPEQTEEPTMPVQKCLRMDNEESLFPGPNHPGQQHQEKQVCLPVDRSFDLPMQNDELLP